REDIAWRRGGRAGRRSVRGAATTRHACALPVAAGLHPGATRTARAWRERVAAPLTDLRPARPPRASVTTRSHVHPPHARSSTRGELARRGNAACAARGVRGG